MSTDDFNSIMRLVDSRLSLPLVYAGCRDILRSRMPADNMYVCLLEKDGLRFPYYIDERLPESSLEIYPKEGWTGYIIDTGRRYWAAKDPPPPIESSPIGPLAQDWLGVPILDREGRTIGVLTVQTYRAHEVYTEAAVKFLEFTADALSVAIQLATQDREIAIRRVAALVEETIDIADLYPKIHEIVQLIVPASRNNIIIARVDEAAGVFIPVYWRDQKDDYNAMRWPLNQGFSGYIYGVIHKSYIYEDKRTPMPEQAIPIGSAPTYWLGAPLYNRDRIIGIVVIQTYDTSEVITKEDEYAVNGICPYIASAISHTELFSRIKGL